MKKKIVIILSSLRSGSTMLFSAFRDSPGISTYYEPMHPKDMYTKDIPEIDHTLKRDIIEFIEHLATIAEHNAVVFKIQLDHLTNQQIMELCRKQHEWTFIVLRRENMRDQYISFEAARYSGKWMIVKGGDSVPEPISINLDTYKAHDYQKKLINKYKIVYNSLAEFFDVCYERDLKSGKWHSNRRITQMRQYCGFSKKLPELKLIRQSTIPYTVENLSEITIFYNYGRK